MGKVDRNQVGFFSTKRCRNHTEDHGGRREGYLENTKKYLFRVLEDNVTYWLRMVKDAQDDIKFRTQLYIEIERELRNYVEDGETPTIWDYSDCIRDLPCVEAYQITDGLYAKEA